jgi:hypothetical protein
METNAGNLSQSPAQSRAASCPARVLAVLGEQRRKAPLAAVNVSGCHANRPLGALTHPLTNSTATPDEVTSTETRPAN